jgi:pimeloyl-ACP methyl ester carboxylesterase
LQACAIPRAVYSPAPLPPNAERLTVRTPDGWDLALTHYAPITPPGRKPEAGSRKPVLLLHGVVTNSRNLDLDEKHSLARWLSSHGYDAYALSVRGKGDSSRPALIGGGKSWDWTFDTYSGVDVPAALAFIQQRTGARQIDCVGHSLGGMMLYALLARGGTPAESVGTVAILGSPMGFRWGPRFNSVAELATSIGKRMPWVPISSPTLALIPIIESYPGPIAPIFYNPANVPAALWSSFLAVGVDDEPGTLIAQAQLWLEKDRFVSADGKIDYESLLADVRTPALVIAGKIDQLGFVPLVRRGFDALAGPKRWVLLAEENGASADYGHMDMLLGENAPRDVFVHIERWLREHESQ